MNEIFKMFMNQMTLKELHASHAIFIFSNVLDGFNNVSILRCLSNLDLSGGLYNILNTTVLYSSYVNYKINLKHFDKIQMPVIYFCISKLNLLRLNYIG